MKRTRSLRSVAAGVLLVALAVLAPTGANAASNSLTAEPSDAYMKGSCDFAVTRNNNETVTARVTLKTVEIKPSIFSPRRVASASILCEVVPTGAETFVSVAKTNPSGSTIYKSQYITVDLAAAYTVCAVINYTLRTGAAGETLVACDPPI